MSLTIVMVADIPSGAEAGFQAYESVVLPLLPRQAVASTDASAGDSLTEVHILSFASQEGFESYLADPERQSHKGLLHSLDVAQRVLLVEDVETPQPPVEGRCRRERGAAAAATGGHAGVQPSTYCTRQNA